MTTRRRLLRTARAALATLAVFSGVAVVDASPAAAYSCSNGDVVGLGVQEQVTLENDLYLPAQQTACPTGAGSISFNQASEANAILAFQNRNATYISTNAPMTTDEWAIAVSSRSDPGVKTQTFFTLPIFIQGFAVTVNLTRCTPPAAGINLTPVSLAAIYSGRATTWGDATIVANNPWLLNCSERISVSVRDGDGWSNSVLKDYLSKRDPTFDIYKRRNFLGAWPPNLSIACRGFSDDGMAACAGNSGAISYLPFQAAVDNGLTIAHLENGKRTFADPAQPGERFPSNCQLAVPDDPSVAAITNDQNFFPLPVGDWSTFSMTYGRGYPLCGFHYVMVWSAPAHAGWSSFDAGTVRDHVLIMLTDQMQEAIKEYGYAPLPGPALLNVRGNVERIAVE